MARPSPRAPSVLLAALLAATTALRAQEDARLPAQTAAASAGTLIVLNKAENTASLVDLPSGRVVATLPTGTGPHEVAVSPDGRWALASNYGTAQEAGSTLTLIDVRRGSVARTVDLGDYHRPHGLAWSRDGHRVLVTVEAQQAVVVLDARTWQVERGIPTDQQTSHMVALSPDGRRAYVASIAAGSVTMLDLVRPQRLRVTQTGLGTEGIAVTPDGREVWATNRGSNTVSVLDARSLDTLATLPSSDFPIRVRFTPDGRWALVTNARSSELRVFDTARREAVGTVAFPFDSTRAAPTLLGAQFARSAVPIGVLPMAGGTYAYVAISAMGAVAEVDLATRAIVRMVAVGREPDGLGYSPLRLSR